MEGSPKRNPDGPYPLLLASMKSGQVTEITPANVVKWSDRASEVCPKRRVNGKVEKWIYTGSGELVP